MKLLAEIRLDGRCDCADCLAWAGARRGGWQDTT